MSNFPISYDNDISLPPVNNNLTEEGGDAINALREAVFNIENNLGLGAAGTTGSLTNRLALMINPDGTPNVSTLTSIGLITLPITNNQIKDNAGIPESKLSLDFPTNTLYNFINDLSRGVNTALSWIDLSGVKLEPHLMGTLYRHTLDEIDVSSNANNFLKNQFGLLRNNTNSYTLINDLNSDFIAHQISDGTIAGASSTSHTPSGQAFPSSYAHTASGVYLNPTLFASIPQTVHDVQQFAEYVDNANTLLLGTKIQTLYQNGIPRTSRATALGSDTKGVSVVPATSATTFISSLSPNDNFASPYGDDIILFTPSSSAISSNVFFSQLSQVKIGDIATVNYGNVIASFTIKEINPTQFTIRLAGKNLSATTLASVDISRSLDNHNKYGVLASAIAPSPISGVQGSLILGSPRGAQATGIGFTPNLIDSSHYNLYLQLYPTGNPSQGITNLVSIDITGNQGATPGSYTLDGIIATTNQAFRKAGFNFRFIAYSYQGEFGVMLAEAYGGASFSIISGIPSTSGGYNVSLTGTTYPNNVIDVINNIDPLGLGSQAANFASPPFVNNFSNTTVALLPTKVISPLQRNFYLINGGESDRFALESNQLLDNNGDAYWDATIIARTISGSTVQTTYQVSDDLTQSHLQAGKTLVAQPSNNDGLQSDFGRFIIQNVVFNSTCTPDGYVHSTNITVYDAVAGTGISPYLTSGVGTAVRLYFNSDSVAFNRQNASDLQGSTNAFPFRRHFEIYLDQDGYSFSHERARFSINASLTNSGVNTGLVNGIQFYVGNSSNLNRFSVIEVSPKLTGYAFSNGGVVINKINLQISSYDSTTGIYQGYLRRLDNVGETNLGNVVSGKRGQITRFYDATNVDYIDLLLDFNDGVISPPGDGYGMDLQIFPSLRLDDQLLLLSTCQVSDNDPSLSQISQLKDRRQFGNVSEQQLSTSAIDFINANARLTQQNGIFKGFDIVGISNNALSLKGGSALVNGKILNINPTTIELPFTKEVYLATQYNINWIVCLNDDSQLVSVLMTDFDSVLATPNAPNRLTTILNVINSQSYAVQASTFTNVVVNKKLTPLYLVASTVSGTGGSAAISLTTTDLRKLANDFNSLAQPVLTDLPSQGNFLSFSAAFTWSRFNSAYQNALDLKSTYTFTTDPGFSPTNLIVNGKGLTAGLIFNVAATLINTVFNNLTLTFNTANATISNCTYNNCTIIAPVSINIGSNTSFNSCSITANAVSQSGTVFNLNGSASKVAFQNCAFNYVPNTSSGYSSSNLINSNKALIYSSVVNLQSLTVDHCNFTTTTATRFSFISLEYNTTSSEAQSINITNNYFYNSSATDDLTAVIAFTSNPTSAQPTEGLKLIASNVSNNICNKNQLISFAGNSSSGSTVHCSIVPVSTLISNNVCGALSMLMASDQDRNFQTSTDGLAYGAHYQLTVSHNNAKLIYTGDHQGFSCSLGPNNADFSTTSVLLEKNICSWIHLVNSSSNSSILNKSIKISHNSFRAYDPTFLTNYQENIPATYAQAIHLGLGTNTRGSCIIDGNTFNTGYFLNSLGSVVLYDYVNYINNQIDSIITNNIFNCNQVGSPLPSTTPVDMITGHVVSGGSIHYQIHHNRFYRNGTTISSYINLNNDSGSLVSNNFFDYSTIDQTSEPPPTTTPPASYLTVKNIGGGSIVEKNKNQVVFTSVSAGAFNWDVSQSGSSSQVLTPVNFVSMSSTYGATSRGWVVSMTSAGSNVAYTLPTLDSLIPTGAQILYMMIGLQLTSGTASASTSYFYISSGNTNTFSSANPPSSFSGSLADIATNSNVLSTTTYYSNQITPTTGSGTQFLYLDLTSDGVYSGNGSLQLFFFTGLTATSVLNVSPVMIRYKW